MQRACPAHPGWPSPTGAPGRVPLLPGSLTPRSSQFCGYTTTPNTLGRHTVTVTVGPGGRTQLTCSAVCCWLREPLTGGLRRPPSIALRHCSVWGSPARDVALRPQCICSQPPSLHGGCRASLSRLVYALLTTQHPPAAGPPLTSGETEAWGVWGTGQRSPGWGGSASAGPLLSSLCPLHQGQRLTALPLGGLRWVPGGSRLSPRWVPGGSQVS